MLRQVRELPEVDEACLRARCPREARYRRLDRIEPCATPLHHRQTPTVARPRVARSGAPILLDRSLWFGIDRLARPAARHQGRQRANDRAIHVAEPRARRSLFARSALAR